MTQIWGHRGASAYAPENTLPAFRLAIEQGADGVEMDVQRSADGELVVIHDETINRTSNGFGKVVELSFEELRMCDYSNGFIGHRNVRIPSLREVLELLAPTQLTINVELKNSIEPYPGMELQVADLLKESGLVDRCVVSSFNHVSLVPLRKVLPRTSIGLLLSDGLHDPWHYARRFGAAHLHPHHLALRQSDYLWLSHEAGITVNTWTVNDEVEIERLARAGVDAIVTNFPDRARRVVDRLGAAH